MASDQELRTYASADLEASSTPMHLSTPVAYLRRQEQFLKLPGFLIGALEVLQLLFNCFMQVRYISLLLHAFQLCLQQSCAACGLLRSAGALGYETLSFLDNGLGLSEFGLLKLVCSLQLHALQLQLNQGLLQGLIGQLRLVALQAGFTAAETLTERTMQ